jgi:hypothetical protein
LSQAAAAARAQEQNESWAIWGYAFGYFAAYAPYSAITKAVSGGRIESVGKIAGLALLPWSTLASVFAMATTMTLLGWWKYARKGGGLPWPGPWTALSGVSTAVIIVTTTLAYTFEGTSIVLMMLLMRGGVLCIAPIVDLVSGRRVRVWSWIALVLSLAALFDAVGTGGDAMKISTGAAVDVVFYLLGYFLRLRFMSKLAKGTLEDNRRFFVEEQMVAAPAAFLTVAAVAAIGVGKAGASFREGFALWHSGPALGVVLLIGLLSQGTGVFGGLVLLDARENSYCVPVNRASSVLAGVLASYGLAWLAGTQPPGPRELVGAGLLLGAILVLSFGPRFAKR